VRGLNKKSKRLRISAQRLECGYYLSPINQGS
jgi:hypothetical protein